MEKKNPKKGNKRRKYTGKNKYNSKYWLLDMNIGILAKRCFTKLLT